MSQHYPTAREVLEQIRAATALMRDAAQEGDLNSRREQLVEALTESERTLGALLEGKLPNDTRTASDLDAFLRSKGVRSVLTKFVDPGGTVQVVADLRPGDYQIDAQVPAGSPHRLDAFGPTASHAFDNLLGQLGE